MAARTERSGDPWLVRSSDRAAVAQAWETGQRNPAIAAEIGRFEQAVEQRLGADVIVQNQPGAGGMVALNHRYVAPQGLEMTIVNGTGAALQQLLDWKGVKFDLTKFGNLAKEYYLPDEPYA